MANLAAPQLDDSKHDTANCPGGPDCPYSCPTRTNPKHTIRVEAEKLSDGSEVFNVTVSGALGISQITIAAVTERDANDLADKIAAAINDHSIEIACVYGW